MFTFLFICLFLLGEDVSNFGKFKPAYRAKKASVFGGKFLMALRKNPGTCTLTLQDLTEVTREPWQDAFSSVNNLRGWEKTGVCPFTRCVQFKLAAKEVIYARKTGNLRFKHTPPTESLSIEDAFNLCADASAASSFCLGLESSSSSNDEEDLGEERVGRVTKGSKRFSSAQVWDKGPLTEGEGCALIKEREKEKNELANEKKRKKLEKSETADKKRISCQEMGKAILEEVDNGKKCFTKLSVNQIDACMIFYNQPIVKGKAADKSAALLAYRVHRSTTLNAMNPQ